LGASACGSGGERQDVTEPSGNFPVQVTKSKFPNRQLLAETSDLELAIKNVGDQTIPDLAVTVYTGETKADGSFNIRVDEPNLANPNRPVWILENEYPKLLTPGVTVKNLDKAPTAGADGSPVKGEFVVTISSKPPQTCVNGSGQVVSNCGP
jgi:hypothetical protein